METLHENGLRSRIGGVILCGGTSRRMGHEKASLPIGHETLLQRVVRITTEQVRPVVVAARRGQRLPPLPADVETVHDSVEDSGPLAGIAAGLEALSDRCDAVFVASCDHPLLKTGFIGRLIELLGDSAAVVPSHNGYKHPLTAVYRISALSIAHAMIAQGDLRAQDFASRCGARIASTEEFADVDPQLDSLRNINDPHAYEQIVGARGD